MVHPLGKSTLPEALIPGSFASGLSWARAQDKCVQSASIEGIAMARQAKDFLKRAR